MSPAELARAPRAPEAYACTAEWPRVRLGDLFDFQNGVNADKAAYGSGIPFANVLEVITRHFLDVSAIPGRVTLPDATIAAFGLRDGDVLFNRTSETQEEVGLASVYRDNAPAVFGGFVIRARPRSVRLTSAFAAYALRSPDVRAQLIARGQGAVRANIGQSDLAQVELRLPAEGEQLGISAALRDADALVESLEQLLAKKRQLKQGAMQELLTGKKRLPGFVGPWVTQPLAKLADIRSGGTPSTAEPRFWDGGIPWCTPTDITALEGRKSLTHTARTISSEGLAASSAELIPAGSIVMTSRATIGECAINEVPVTTNQGFKNFVAFEATDPHFLYYLLRTQTQRFISLCGGSTFLEIGKAQLKSFEVEVPAERDEQSAIATVLSTLDAELEALEARLAKARALKQGMAQALLTGRIRLAPFGEQASAAPPG